MRKVGSYERLTAGAITITAVTLLALFASSLAGAAKVEPIFLAGASNQGKDCEDNDGAGQTWSQLKVDPNRETASTRAARSPSRSRTPRTTRRSTGARTSALTP